MIRRGGISVAPLTGGRNTSINSVEGINTRALRKAESLVSYKPLRKMVRRAQAAATVHAGGVGVGPRRHVHMRRAYT